MKPAFLKRIVKTTSFIVTSHLPSHNRSSDFRHDEITLLDTAMGSENAGDQIIMSYVQKQMGELFPQQSFKHLPTHTYSSVLESAIKNERKFVCGTNMLTMNLKENNPLALPLLRLTAYHNSVVLLAVGMRNLKQITAKAFTPYSVRVLKYLLDPTVLHSVRDEQTKRALEEAGIRNVVNTACVTMWDLTPDFCTQIPTSKNVDVLTTVTDYARDPEQDKFMLETLIEHYRNVYFWIQAEEDLEYVSSLIDINQIKTIGHHMSNLDAFLSEHKESIDYFGTRLHAGVHCLNHKVRSMIVVVDNRARAIGKDTNIPVIERDDLRQRMEQLIEEERSTSISLPFGAIERWKNQFQVTRDQC
ncbi:polysaccharide pyruvyl transferase family protein [Bifidobacterium panos]|uniref:Capsular biosynthesis protein n=1 Tax=Bifidobacterium panos TaxID=2675321 RepID=A0ABX1SZA4_9BIFI|nr:polysaccharide pyruvyl transferase family protein [Bifidobacterium sp. DSM 109963]NMN02477.1 capsular biosynthesis protein [Bifidobacterium sp. DSM 109963]